MRVRRLAVKTPPDGTCVGIAPRRRPAIEVVEMIDDAGAVLAVDRAAAVAAEVNERADRKAKIFRRLFGGKIRTRDFGRRYATFTRHFSPQLPSGAASSGPPTGERRRLSGAREPQEVGCLDDGQMRSLAVISRAAFHHVRILLSAQKICERV